MMIEKGGTGFTAGVHNTKEKEKEFHCDFVGNGVISVFKEYFMKEYGNMDWKIM